MQTYFSSPFCHPSLINLVCATKGFPG